MLSKDTFSKKNKGHSMSQYKLIKLQQQLTHFGLNPSEWSIERVQALQFRIQHKLEQNFILKGSLEYKNKIARWRSLEVISI